MTAPAIARRAILCRNGHVVPADRLTCPTCVGRRTITRPQPKVAVMEQRLLVCEGDCNPHVRDLDTALEDAMELGAPEKGWPDWLIGALRTLKHTPHLPLSNGVVWGCTSCGTERKY